jgi:hypothetical protein
MEIFVKAPFYRYPAVMMISPVPYLIEYDFLEKLPFLLEKQPNLVMESAKQIHFTRQITLRIAERNQHVTNATSNVFQTGTASFNQIQMIIQLQESIGVAECVAALELFEAFERVAKSLEIVVTSYKVKDENSKLVTPPALQEYLAKLKVIRTAAIATMRA